MAGPPLANSVRPALSRPVVAPLLITTSVPRHPVSSLPPHLFLRVPHAPHVACVPPSIVCSVQPSPVTLLIRPTLRSVLIYPRPVSTSLITYTNPTSSCYPSILVLHSRRLPAFIFFRPVQQTVFKFSPGGHWSHKRRHRGRHTDGHGFVQLLTSYESSP